MASDDVLVGPEKLRFTAKLVIKVTPHGIAVHTHPIAKPMPVQLAELALMSALDEVTDGVTSERIERAVSSVSEAYATDPARLRQLVDRLTRMRVLAPVSAGTPAVPPRAATRPRPPEGSASPLDLSDRILLHCTLVLRLRGGVYEYVGHEGHVLFALSPLEASALASLSRPATREQAWERHRADVGAHALDAERFDVLVRKLHAHRVLTNTQLPEWWYADATAFKTDRFEELARHFQAHALAQDAAERERDERTGKTRIRVVPVAFDQGTPLGVGLVLSYARAYDGGRLKEHYDFRFDWVWAPDRFEVFTQRPAVYLFSNYLWSHGRNAAISAAVKAASPASVTIHGGPDTPRYKNDVERYFAEHPHVDVTIGGEGEGAAAEVLDRLAGAWDKGGPVDLSVLADVPGISFRHGDAIVHTPPRGRIQDLDSIPSPFLTGMFDGFRGVPELSITLETNRGCPYGCTFCDWGAATMTKIRQYSLDRVFAELRWCSDVEASAVGIADANFGIFARDVEIAQEIARLSTETGSPRGFGCNYAKNAIKYTKPIIEVLSRAGIVAQGLLALQTSDAETLSAVNRSNIKPEKYDQLAHEMREADLPLVVELMIGLPGSTVESFKTDLQQCIDREQSARINTTTVLINSPMNDPAYREAHGIVTDRPHAPGVMPLLVASRSFTREDHATMLRLRRLFMLLEHFGCLRHVSRFVRQETGMREIDFIERLMVEVPQRAEYPLLGVLLTSAWGLMAPPVSWHLVFDELRHYLVHALGMKDDSALDTILDVQASLLPAADRAFPLRRSYPHDVVAWHRAMLDAKRRGSGVDWTKSTPRLGELGPGELVVDDPGGWVRGFLGVEIEKSSVGAHWELESPLSRRILPAGSDVRADLV